MSNYGILMDMRHANAQVIERDKPFTVNTLYHMLRAKDTELRVYSCVLDDIPVRIYVKSPPQGFERQRHPIPRIDSLYGSAFIACDDATADGFTITPLNKEHVDKLMRNTYTYTLRRGKYGQLLCDSLMPPADGYRRMHFLRLSDFNTRDVSSGYTTYFSPDPGYVSWDSVRDILFSDGSVWADGRT